MDSEYQGHIMLTKGGKPISRVKYMKAPLEMPNMDISDIQASEKFDLSGLRSFLLHPAWCNGHQEKEWEKFTVFLMMHNRVARVLGETHTFYILPPDMGTNFFAAIVFYHMRRGKGCNRSGPCVLKTSTSCINTETSVPPRAIARPCAIKSGKSDESDLDEHSGKGDCKLFRTTRSEKFALTSGHHPSLENKENVSCRTSDSVERNYVNVHPKFLKALGQTHSSWIFGAIAELVDNARDAKATKLDISIQFIKKDGKEIPMLAIVDNGHGMTHQEILTMLSLGHEAPDRDDPSHIGQFGTGFKTGSMKLGRDAIVLTQTPRSRSIGFLSQSLNEGKKMLETPIVSYCMEGPMMEFDTTVHTKAEAEYNLKVIKEFSGFNEYYLGAMFSKYGPGTQIYIWNLEEYGGKYSLDWKGKNDTLPEGDILTCSMKIRRRPGQISQKVPLDTSLRSYLEVIYLNPKMKISVQDSVVKSCPLAKSLYKTAIIKGDIMGKPVQVTLGRSQREWEQMNCGIFLYWHGRLIEAYKRVGGMVHNADMGRGVIGVIDVTNLMSDGKDVWVRYDKQTFQDTEVYAKLEDWLGCRADEYWDNNFDNIQVKKSKAGYKPDHDWVQCDKCRKWRILSTGYDTTNLPQEWFCYLPPFSGKCETPEHHLDDGVIDVSTKRSGCDPKRNNVHLDAGARKNSKHALNDDSDCSAQTEEENDRRTLKLLRRGPH